MSLDRPCRFLGWLRLNEQSIAIWLEGIALVAIFFLELKEYRRLGRDKKEQREDWLSQMAVMQSQADDLVNSERAWIVAELVPQAVKFGDHWCRIVGSGYATVSTEEVLAGHNLRYKLKFANMGRTPAQIFGFTIRYRCLGESVTDLPENACGNQASTHPFEHLLAGNGDAVEIGDPHRGCRQVHRARVRCGQELEENRCHPRVGEIPAHVQ